MNPKDKVFRNYCRNKSKKIELKRLRRSKIDKDYKKLKVKDFVIYRKSKIYPRTEIAIQVWHQLQKGHITKITLLTLNDLLIKIGVAF
jgi:hypothetical protein